MLCHSPVSTLCLACFMETGIWLGDSKVFHTYTVYTVYNVVFSYSKSSNVTMVTCVSQAEQLVQCVTWCSRTYGICSNCSIGPIT